MPTAKTRTSRRKTPPRENFKAYFDQAKKNGIASIETKKGDKFYVVNLESYVGDTPAPFKGMETLLVPPNGRAAYSDRTAWLMAVLSELAYLPFEKSSRDKEKLELSLAGAKLYLMAYFSDKETGTQAFLARRPGDFIVLVFRGTEKTGKDIKTDLNARFYKTAHGKIHKGFSHAYESIHDKILLELEKLNKKIEKGPEPLFVAGHSLGGALATIAAQNLETSHPVAACYTFGSPRVGGPEWSASIKTPVYRVVNEADPVPSVPFGIGLRAILTFILKISPFNWINKPIEKLLNTGFVGFQHAGDLRFLSGKLDVSNLKIGSAAYSARGWYMISGYILIPFKKIKDAALRLSLKSLATSFQDHSIAHYSSKLRVIAVNRN